MNRSKDFYILMMGRFISGSGSYFNMVAINLFILLKTGSPTITGLSMAVRILTACLASPYLGTLADKLDRKRSMMISDLLLGASMLLIAVAPDRSIVTLIFAVQIALGIFNNFFMINFQAALPLLAPGGDLLKANSWFQIVNCLTVAVGALGAAFVINMIGYRGAFVVDGLSYLVSFIILAMLPIITQERSPATKEVVASEGFSSALKTLAKASPFIFFIFLVRLLDGVGSGSHNIAMPIFSDMALPSDPSLVYGLLLASWGVGSIVSVLLLNCTEFGKKLHLESMFVYSTVLMSIFWILTFQSFDRSFFMIAAFLAGIFDTAATVSYSIVLQRSEDSIRGRVMAMSAMTMTAGFGGGMAFSAMMAGFVPPALLVIIWHGIPIACILFFALKRRSAIFASCEIG